MLQQGYLVKLLQMTDDSRSVIMNNACVTQSIYFRFFKNSLKRAVLIKMSVNSNQIHFLLFFDQTKPYNNATSWTEKLDKCCLKKSIKNKNYYKRKLLFLWNVFLFQSRWRLCFSLFKIKNYVEIRKSLHRTFDSRRMMKSNNDFFI